MKQLHERVDEVYKRIFLYSAAVGTEAVSDAVRDR